MISMILDDDDVDDVVTCLRDDWDDVDGCDVVVGCTRDDIDG